MKNKLHKLDKIQKKHRDLISGLRGL